MRIYPETRLTLEHFHDWATIKSVALARGVTPNGLNARIGTCLKAGLIERRVVGEKKSRPCKSWHYVYRMTEAGRRAVYPAMYMDDTPAPAAPTPIRSNPWENLRYG